MFKLPTVLLFLQYNYKSQRIEMIDFIIGYLYYQIQSGTV